MNRIVSDNWIFPLCKKIGNFMILEKLKKFSMSELSTMSICLHFYEPLLKIFWIRFPPIM